MPMPSPTAPERLVLRCERFFLDALLPPCTVCFIGAEATSVAPVLGQCPIGGNLRRSRVVVKTTFGSEASLELAIVVVDGVAAVWLTS